MAGRHHVRRGLSALAHRHLNRRITVVLLAVALSAGIGVAVLLHRPRTLPPPLMMPAGQAPSAPGSVSAEPSAAGVPEATTTARPVTPSPSVSAGPTPSGSPTPRPTVQPSPSRTTPAPVASRTLTVRYDPGGVWGTGFIGDATVTNTGSTPQRWRVEITFPAGSGAQVTSSWNADFERSGGRTYFNGGPLAPGESQSFGFAASKTVPGAVQPTGVSVSRIP